MAIAKDTHDILDVFVIENFSKIANFQENIVVPQGLQDFITVETVDHIRDLNFPRDVRELLENYILVKKLDFLSSVPQASSTSQPSNINQSERVFTS
ncbi:hypothetical protein [Anaerosinus gibii]|uniref:Uncharacterized protein n=1 Tax=Selenobaculum gibii TaxID=3054208 RepID=A0A9Y2AIS6_9FIRM|nr:hypothetical protein [Selenobaculum gbiensis]WIW70763.1 hypothetical protein P3F81_00060 [Selenobaculum gbiensis]